MVHVGLGGRFSLVKHGFRLSAKPLPYKIATDPWIILSKALLDYEKAQNFIYKESQSNGPFYAFLPILRKKVEDFAQIILNKPVKHTENILNKNLLLKIYFIHHIYINNI